MIRSAIVSERGRLWLAGQIRDGGAFLYRGANNHAFIAAQIDDAFHLLAVPVQKRGQQDFAA